MKFKIAGVAELPQEKVVMFRTEVKTGYFRVFADDKVILTIKPDGFGYVYDGSAKDVGLNIKVFPLTRELNEG